MSSVATISAFALIAFGALFERAVCVPQGEATITPAPIVLGTVQALPDINAAATSSGGCGGCYIVADVAALVWYSEVFINTAATELVSIGVGNGSRTTRTSIIQNNGGFTFDPSRMSSAFSSDVALTPVTYASTVNIGGAILTSPTAYNVYSAYSITSAHIVDGSCVTTSGSATTLSTPYSETLASANGRVTLDASGEQAFIDYLGFSKCSGGGLTATNTALIPVANVTQTTTTTGNSVSLGAQSLSLAPTTNPTSTAVPAGAITLTEIMSSTTVTAVLTGTAFPAASATAPVIVAGSTTLTPSAGVLSLPAIEPSVLSAIFSNATAVPPTGTVTGTGVGNYSVVPFLSSAGRIGGYSTVLSGVALLAAVFTVGFL